ncbi:hypothetical protein NMG60_11003316 [Bertholletia excelsa]
MVEGRREEEEASATFSLTSSSLLLPVGSLSLRETMAEKGQPLPKFGEWDVNDPASAEEFTVIFNKARNEKRTGGKPELPAKEESAFKQGTTLGKPQSKKWLCCIQSAQADN